MIRDVIKIDEELCNGCGICVSACHEGAIAMVEGKAKLLREDYCDGLGACLPACPTGAITVEKREAAAFDETVAEKNPKSPTPEVLACGCPGTHSQTLLREDATTDVKPIEISTQLKQWPVQIQLVPVNAAYFANANLLIAADCAAYAYGNFHTDYMKNKVTIIGCPKLDTVDYSEKLTEILHQNDIKSVTVVRMEVPCCGGLEQAVKTALMNCGKLLPWQTVTIATNGNIIES